MWKQTAFIGLIVFLLAPEARGQEGGRFGIGIVLGQPVGIAWKYRMESTNALAGSVGVGPYERFRFQFDYLWHAHPFKEKALSLHYGVGAAIGIVGSTTSAFSNNGGSGEAGFGIRGVVGLTYGIRNSPVDLFFEMAPLIVFAPSTGTGLDIGFGARVYP